MRFTGNLFALALLLLAATVSPALAYEVLTPPLKEKVLVHARRAESHLIIKTAGKEEAGQLRVGRVTNREGDTKKIEPLGAWEKDGSFFIHYILDLKKGANTFNISPGDKEITIRYQPMRTLLNVDPNDPQSYLFHRNETVPAVCNGCHTEKLPAAAKLDVKQLQKNGNFSPLCYSCHWRLTKKKAPSASGLISKEGPKEMRILI